MRAWVVAATLAAAAGLASPGASAQSPIDGTWKIDPKTVEAPSKPVRFSLGAGVYECASCLPPVKVQADGKDQSVAGSAHADTLAVTVLNERSFRTVARKDGKPVSEVLWTMSADGKTLTRDARDTRADGRIVSAKALMRRVERAPAGAQAISGTWLGTGMESMSDSLVTFKTAGGVLTMSTPEGATYRAKLDGTMAPVTGDPGAHEVSVQQKGPRTFEEMSYRDGHRFLTTVITVDPGGKSARVRWTTEGNQARGGYTLRRQ
jgi:hypothetical protein